MKSTLPAVNGTPPRREIVEYIPPLRGDLRGVCLFLFLFILFSPILVFSV
jgi:hypothetical protein